MASPRKLYISFTDELTIVKNAFCFRWPKCLIKCLDEEYASFRRKFLS